MTAFSMVSFTMFPNSSNPLLRAVEFVNMMPTPTINDSSRAVRMSHIGGILSSM